ncbi:MAG: tRNA (adenosine(37)-N6)-threonylcarbamoyltransferase complex dimerization subunit type 1 TsaB [Desulfobacterales bacterium]|jgi:tRNA threonylcarbamoyladenosine biosynthesis protein TsaB
MNVLALDTATPCCSVAALVDGELAAEVVNISGETHSRHLMAMVDQVVRMSIGSVKDFDGFAVTHGPGSFTGLRIGISAAKGLASAVGRPLLGVSSLRVLAEQMAGATALICPLIDARRNEVYAGRFKLRGGRLEELWPESVAAPERAVEGIEEPCILVGSGAALYRERLLEKLGARGTVAPSHCHTVRASTVAFMASDMFETGAAMAPAALVPAYLRDSYATERRWKG